MAAIGIASIASATLAMTLQQAARATATERSQACQLARWAVQRTSEHKSLSPQPFLPKGLLAKPSACFVTISV
ncbi:MAG: hypothetical protein WCL39_14090, partial [Armatimonadota bacterium]